MSSNQEFNTAGEALVLSGNADTADVSKKSILSNLSEDIWAIIIGGFLIAIVLVAAFVSPGFKFSTPAYQWETAGDLFTKVLSFNNVLLLAGIGLSFALLS